MERGGNLKGSSWQTRLEIIKAIKDAVHEGKLKKGDVLNPYRIYQLTGKDIRTAKQHMPSLSGEKVNGRLTELNPGAGPWLIIDEPSDEWLDLNLNKYIEDLNGGDDSENPSSLHGVRYGGRNHASFFAKNRTAS